jgi:hypothetical protein
MREITVTESPGCDHAEWTVEERNDADDKNDVAIFVGAKAKRRAKLYADWLRRGLD